MKLPNMDENTMWGRYQLLVILFAAVLVKPDSTAALHGVFINGPDSYLVYRFPKSQTVFITEISFTFSTKACKGVIVEMTSKDGDSFYQFSLNKMGALDFSFKSGGEGKMYIPPSTRNSFCNGEKHTFHFRREGYDVTIRVNDSLKIERGSFPNLYNPFSKPDLLIIGKTGRSETLPHFRGCINQVQVLNYKTRGDPQPTEAEPIAIYLQRKSSLVDGRNIHACDYVPTTPRLAGQRMSKADVNNSTSKSTVVLGNPLVLSAVLICQATWICRTF